MKKVIVTGSTGFIGSWFVQELLKHKILVTLIVREKGKLLPEFKNDPCVNVIEGEINLSIIDKIRDKNFDAFVHMAWSGVSPEEKNDFEFQLANISLSLSAIELAKKLGSKKFVVTGTVAEHVFCDNVMDVYAQQSPNDMYGAAKVSTYYFLKVRARQLKIPLIWTIVPSTFGPRRVDNNIITYTILNLLQRKKPLYGELTQMWDFLYVGEVVRAIRLVCEFGKGGKVYGIGSGKYRPLKTYIEEIRDIIDKTLVLGIGEKSEMTKQSFSSCVDIHELTVDTGFIPQVSFEEGIRMTIEYFGKQFITKNIMGGAGM